MPQPRQEHAAAPLQAIMVWILLQEAVQQIVVAIWSLIVEKIAKSIWENMLKKIAKEIWESFLKKETKVSLKFESSVVYSYDSPCDIVKYGHGYIITDESNNSLISYNPADNICRSFYIHGYSCHFAGLSTLPHSTGILVTDCKNGEVILVKNDVPRKLIDGLKFPLGITVHKDEIFVVESFGPVIKVIDLHGNFLRSFGGGNCLCYPRYIAVNSKDKLYVTDSEDIKVFKTSGEYVERFKISVHSRGWPYRGIAIDKHDNIFVTARTQTNERAEETITVLNPNHKVLVHYTGGHNSMHQLLGLCIDYDRNNLVVVDGEHRKLKIHKSYE